MNPETKFVYNKRGEKKTENGDKKDGPVVNSWNFHKNTNTQIADIHFLLSVTVMITNHFSFHFGSIY